MTFSDESLGAYADDQLPMDERAGLEAALATDSQLSARLKAHLALRAQLRGAFDPVLSEPVPAALINAVTQGAQSQDHGQVIAFPRRRGWNRAGVWWSGMGIAASLVLGVALGRGVAPGSATDLTVAQNGTITANGALAGALERQTSGPTTEKPIQIGLSFRAADAGYCRTFRLTRSDGSAGIACREPKGWSVRMLAATGPAPSAAVYRRAASDYPSAVMETVQSMAVGSPMDSTAERVAITRGWR